MTSRTWTFPATCLAIGLIAGCGGPIEEGRVPVVQVLPFEVVGQEDGGSYLGLALARSISGDLARADRIEVLDTPDDGAPDDAATHLVRGTLERDGRALRVVLRLESVTDRRPLWETETASAVGDLPGIVSALARPTLEQLGVAHPVQYDYPGYVTGGAEMSASQIYSEAGDAWRTGDIGGFVVAADRLAQQFPNEAAAHVLFAWALMLGYDAEPAEETLTRLGETLVTLDRLDPGSPYDELLRAYVYRSSGAPDPALELYATVLSRDDLSNANRAWTLRQRALTHLQKGDAAAAHADAEMAVALAPTNGLSLMVLSKILETLDELDEAAERARMALALQPLSWRLHQRLGIVLIRAVRFDDAVLSLDRACELGRTQEACANLSNALQKGGDPQRAREAAEFAASLVATPWGEYNLACFHALAGEPANALDDLRGAIDRGFADALIDTDPDLDTLRGDPDFERLVEEVAERIRLRREMSTSVFPWQA